MIIGRRWIQERDAGHACVREIDIIFVFEDSAASSPLFLRMSVCRCTDRRYVVEGCQLCPYFLFNQRWPMTVKRLHSESTLQLSKSRFYAPAFPVELHDLPDRELSGGQVGDNGHRCTAVHREAQNAKRQDVFLSRTQRDVVKSGTWLYAYTLAIRHMILQHFSRTNHPYADRLVVRSLCRQLKLSKNRSGDSWILASNEEVCSVRMRMSKYIPGWKSAISQVTRLCPADCFRSVYDVAQSVTLVDLMKRLYDSIYKAHQAHVVERSGLALKAF